jgi:hypothetical protein
MEGVGGATFGLAIDALLGRRIGGKSRAAHRLTRPRPDRRQTRLITVTTRPMMVAVSPRIGA